MLKTKNKCREGFNNKVRFGSTKMLQIYPLRQYGIVMLDLTQFQEIYPFCAGSYKVSGKVVDLPDNLKYFSGGI